MLTPVMTVACADHKQSHPNTHKYILSLSPPSGSNFTFVYDFPRCYSLNIEAEM